MKKIYTLLISITFISCASSRQFKEDTIEPEYTFTGDIKQIHITGISYPYESDIESKSVSTVFYGEKNRFLKQIFYIEDTIILLTKSYNNNGLVVEEAWSGILPHLKPKKYIFTYNNDGMIETSKLFINDTLKNEKVHKYDNYKNVLETKIIDDQNKIKISRYTYDYRKRTALHTYTKEELPPVILAKSYYNKVGYVIKEESFDKFHNISSTTVYRYDKSRNKIEQIHYKKNSIDSLTYKFEHDKIGNIIKSEMYINNELKYITSFDIIYK